VQIYKRVAFLILLFFEARSVEKRLPRFTLYAIKKKTEFVMEEMTINDQDKQEYPPMHTASEMLRLVSVRDYDLCVCA
jgi:hypothetical protein